ncbi:jg3936 [Pararge aegeria aegeria]|uniref:Jg3936 protein n=1 Tax=Pararge aegeria aegeria TaxID=348720 RepID=A0A8S4RT95_9NEOP|nr:jg3936 [Pararge aegeria aegeria]
MNSFNAPTTQINSIDKMTTVKCKSVDLEGYVIIVVQTKDNKIKLYGSPSAGNWENLELADEIMDVNETRLEDMTRTEVLSHIHEENIVRKPESSPLCSQRCVESTNPHWASVVDYGLKPFSLWEDTCALK